MLIVGKDVNEILSPKFCSKDSCGNNLAFHRKGIQAMIRKIHLDFHTRPEVQGIGAGFDPELFASTLAAAHVNYL
jgi:hypothetical protein